MNAIRKGLGPRDRLAVQRLELGMVYFLPVLIIRPAFLAGAKVMSKPAVVEVLEGSLPTKGMIEK